MRGGAEPASRRDRFATLLTIYRLHTAPVWTLGEAARHQSHPAVAAIKQRCEEWLTELEALPFPAGIDDADPVAAMRALAARDRLPNVYKWLARDASWDDVVTFLALEGGPDAGFDDLVAVCQIGLTGPAKLELATNYWDEMGGGDLAAVHTTLHEDLVAAIDLPHLPLSGQPTSALERAALGGLLATNRWLQPEMLGALGLIELQAGPRCRLVLQALARCGAPAGAYPFYGVQRERSTPARSGLARQRHPPSRGGAPPEGSTSEPSGGAHWRNAVNVAFFEDAKRMLHQESPYADLS